jgi:hypothetical protein
MIRLSELIDRFLPALRQRHGQRLRPEHEHALRAMVDCRTERSPTMLVQCGHCGNQERIPHACELDS